MSTLQITDLRVQRGSFVAELPSLSILPGTFAGLVGRSGSGKSTLLEAIAGFLPASGKICVGDKQIQDLPPEQRRVAMVFQRPALFSHLNLVENVAFGLRVQGVPKPQRLQRARDWLQRVGLAGLEKRAAGELSEGQAQRAAFARALIVGFPVLLLDEPFSALDVQTRKETRDLLESLVRETQVAVLLVSHHPEDVETLASQVLVQVDGRASKLS